MRRSCLSGLANAALALLLTLALAAAGWARRVPDAADRATVAALAAYVSVARIADGLCGIPADLAHQDDGCPVCRMPVLLPLPVRAETPGETLVSGLFPPICATEQSAPSRHPAWQGRAPPVV